MEKLYTVQDVCERYQVKNCTVWSWIRKGEIKGFKIGKLYRFCESDLKDFEEKKRAGE